MSRSLGNDSCAGDSELPLPSIFGIFSRSSLPAVDPALLTASSGMLSTLEVVPGVTDGPVSRAEEEVVEDGSS